MSKIYKFDDYSKQELESLLSKYNSKDIILYSDVETNSTYIYIINSESYATISYPNDNNINSFYQNINNLYWEDDNSTHHSLNTENVEAIDNVLNNIKINHIDTTNFVEHISKSDKTNNITSHYSYWVI